MARRVVEVSASLFALVLLVALAVIYSFGGLNEFAASITGFATSQQPTTSAIIGNGAPTAGTCYMPTTLTLAADGNVSAYCNCSVDDTNGFGDIVFANATLFNFTTAGAVGAANHYTKYVNQTCTLTGGSGTAVWSNCSFEFSYFAAPGDWKCAMLVNDSANNVLNMTTTAVMNVPTLVAITTDPSSVSYGSISPGANGSAVTFKINNVGNIKVDIKKEASNLTTGGAQKQINVSNQWYAYDVAWTAGNVYQFANESTFNATYDLAATTSNTVVNRTEYYKLAVDPGQPAGTYTGLITITAQEG